MRTNAVKKLHKIWYREVLTIEKHNYRNENVLNICYYNQRQTQKTEGGKKNPPMDKTTN